MEQTVDVLLADQPVVTRNNQEVESLRRDHNWFLAVTDAAGLPSYYLKEELSNSLYTDIIAGKFLDSDEVVTYTKTNDGTWNETRSTLFNFAKSQFALHILFEPVWAHAMAGLKWGAVVGIGLKLLDTFFLFASVAPSLGFLFAVAVGVCFVPRIGVPGMVMIGFAMAKFAKVNLFFAALGAGVVGAILGCLPGMAIGGIIGLIRRPSLPQALDANSERPELLFTAVILPLIGGAVLFALYVSVFNPWLVGLLE